MSEPRQSAASPGLESLLSLRPSFRNGVKTHFHEFAGTRYGILEDTVTGRFHKFGPQEYDFISRFDGKTTVRDALQALSGYPHPFSEGDAGKLVMFLVHHDLLHGIAKKNGNDEDRQALRAIASAGKHNPISFRVPLGNPDPLFEKLYPWLRWTCTTAFGLVWAFVLSVGLFTLWWNFDRFLLNSLNVLDSWSWVWLGLAWFLLKIVHETAHAQVCKHYGGFVREAGLYMILFVPMGYVDASASWRFSSKWQRIHVAAAGMMAELFIASFAILIWANSEPGLVSTVAHAVVFMASVVTVAFNANPLMKFDGYYILCDLTETPNLGPRSFAHWTAILRRYLFGRRDSVIPRHRHWRDWFITLYGLAAFFWRILIFISLSMGAAYLFKGAGFLFAVIGVSIWLLPMVWQFRTILASRKKKGEKRSFPWGIFLPRLAILLLAGGIVLFFPIRFPVKVAGVVRFADSHPIRAEAPGFIEKVHVSEGAEVAEGQLLMTLHNRNETTSLEVAALAVKQQEIRASLALLDQDMAAYQAEMASLESLRSQYGERRKRVDSLKVHSPIPGRIVSARLDQMQGMYVHTGDVAIRVASPAGKEVVLAVPEHLVDAFRGMVGQTIQVKVPGVMSPLRARLIRVTSRASREITLPELTSLANGSLAVMPRTEGSSASSSRLRRAGSHSSSINTSAYELVDPHFEATAEILSTSMASPLLDGQRVRARLLPSSYTSLGTMLYDFISRWFSRLIRILEANPR